MEPEEKMRILRNWEGRIITAQLEDDSMWGMFFFMFGVMVVMVLLLLNEQ